MATDRTDHPTESSGTTLASPVIDLCSRRKPRVDAVRRYTEQDLRNARADGYRTGFDEGLLKMAAINTMVEEAYRRPALTVHDGGRAS